MNTNVKLIQDLFAAFVKGDVPAIMAHIDPKCTWCGSLSPELPYSGKMTGPAEISRFFKGIAESLDVRVFNPARYVAEGDDVVAIGDWSGFARATGKPYHSHFALLFTVRNGKVVNYLGSEDTAITAAALRP
jgi:ketosteroid isomerase-like protein